MFEANLAKPRYSQVIARKFSKFKNEHNCLTKQYNYQMTNTDSKIIFLKFLHLTVLLYSLLASIGCLFLFIENILVFMFLYIIIHNFKI